jgi:hypothetical protein
MVLSARLFRPKVIGRDHTAPEELYVKDRVDQFASYFAAQQRLLRSRPLDAVSMGLPNLPSKWGHMTSTTSKGTSQASRGTSRFPPKGAFWSTMVKDRFGSSAAVPSMRAWCPQVIQQRACRTGASTLPISRVLGPFRVRKEFVTLGYFPVPSLEAQESQP